jgi:imidazolonepropionase-like amidohydrolase
VVVEQGRFHLYWVQQLAGTETYVVRARGDSLILTSDFEYVDRGTRVPLKTRMVMREDFAPLSFHTEGKIARRQAIEERVDIAGSIAVMRSGLVTKTQRVQRPFFTLAAYAPAAVQMMMIRHWSGNGRPARMAVLPEGEVGIEFRGRDVVSYAGHEIVLQRYAVTGVVWGSETLWTDARGKLIAAVTIDGEGEPFEIIRDGFESLLSYFVARGVEDGMARLAAMGRLSSFARNTAYALVGARLIDGRGGRPLDNATIVFRGDSIVAVGPGSSVEIPPDVRTVDLGGRTVLPGLWDMHAHVQQVEWGPAYLAAGVTTVRDCGNGFEFVTSVRDALERGEGIGPHMVLAGVIIGNEVETVSDALGLVRKYKNARFDQIKIYSFVSPRLVPAIADEAHRLGMTVTGHVPEGMDVVQAVNAGFDQISHLGSVVDAMTPEPYRHLSQYRRPLPDSTSVEYRYVLDYLSSYGTVLDPALAIVEYSNRPFSQPIASFEPGFETVPPELRRMLGAYGVSPSEAPARERYLEVLKNVLAEAHELGIPIVAGSDMGVPGHTLHRELELYVEAGLSPMEAIQSATSTPARVLGLDDRAGTIEPGKMADLLILDADPLDDISNIRRIYRVVRAGRFFDPVDLWRRVGFSILSFDDGSARP